MSITYLLLFICPKYDRLREKYLPLRFRRFPSSAKFIDLISLNNDQTVISLSTFVYQAFKVRKQTEAPPIFRTKMTAKILPLPISVPTVPVLWSGLEG